MWDIFISYSGKDKLWVETLASALKKQGFSIWWDSKILAGQDFEKTIGVILDKVKCVITVWSYESIESHWVKAESSRALSRGILIPVLYQNVQLPLPFDRIHTADLQDWNGDTDDDNFQSLLMAIESICKSEEKPHLSMKSGFFSKLLQLKKRKSTVTKKFTLLILLMFVVFFIYKEGGGYFNSIFNFQSGNKSNQILNSPGASIIGDTSTSADKRYDAALSEIKDELTNNANQLANIIYSIEYDKPSFYNDTRRINEPESSYQDRAKANFRDYINSISNEAKLIEYAKNKYSSFQRDLSYNSKTLSLVNSAYQYFEDSLESLSEMEAQFNNIISQKSSDNERIKAAILIHEEKLADVKMNYFNGLSYVLYLLNKEDLGQLQLGLLAKENNLILEAGQVGSQSAKEIAAKSIAKKSKAIENETNFMANSGQMPVSKTINDPYLIEHRKLLGLPAILSEDELSKINSKIRDGYEKDISKLLGLAGLSFQESDGSTSLFYLNRVLELSQDKENSIEYNIFAKKSIERLLSPDKYDGGIGYLILEVNEKGVFFDSGLEKNDILIKVNSEIIYDPLKIATFLAAKDNAPVLLQIMRDNEKKIVALKRKDYAGAKITSLVIYNPVQI